MNNLEKYKNTFNSVLNINVNEIQGDITSDSVHQWDSITHLRLVTTIEDEFNVMLESEDILEFKSFEKGLEILKKYEVEF
jgi:acyl carrier protein